MTVDFKIPDELEPFSKDWFVVMGLGDRIFCEHYEPGLLMRLRGHRPNWEQDELDRLQNMLVDCNKDLLREIKLKYLHYSSQNGGCTFCGESTKFGVPFIVTREKRSVTCPYCLKIAQYE